jgi:hypothetical protein
MYRHASTCLKGPVSRSRPWWQDGPGEDAEGACRGAVGKTSDGSAGAVRQELIDRVRREISAGTYDTPEKWQAALDRLVKRIEEA